MKTGRVLSLAGGGTWALVEARALMELFPNQTGRQILAQFDVAIANSGGSIVLAGLAADMTPAQIYALFQDQTHLHQLYTPCGGIDELFSRFELAPRWSSVVKLKGLQTILGEAGSQPIDQLGVNIAICAYDLDRNAEVIFRSYASPLEATSGGFIPTLAEAVHASSSAPVIYFDAPAVITNQRDATDTRRFFDGGLGSYNLPVRAGLSEAHALGLFEVDILSLATNCVWRPIGNADNTLYAPPSSINLLGTITCLAHDCLNAPGIAALCDTHVCPDATLVHLCPYLRPDGTPGAWTAPINLATALGADAWAKLVGFDMDLTAPDDVALLARYADAWIAGYVPNAPILTDPRTGAALAGSKVFGEGANDWRHITTGITPDGPYSKLPVS